MRSHLHAISMRAFVLVASMAILLSLPMASQAGVIVTFHFEGVVTELDVNAGLFGPFGTVNLGDPFTGRVSYEIGPSNPDLLPADPEVGGYNALAFVVDNAVIPFSSPLIRIRHRPGLPTIPPVPPDLGEDSFTAFAQAPGSQYAAIRLILEAPFDAVFTDDSLPTDLDLEQFSARTLQGLVAIGLPPLPTIDDSGRITELTRQTGIPEPSSLLLWATGFLVFVASGYRQSRRSSLSPLCKSLRFRIQSR